jgi:tripartite-type tricarboxylate transporter receptor subunit TctC
MAFPSIKIFGAGLPPAQSRGISTTCRHLSALLACFLLGKSFLAPDLAKTESWPNGIVRITTPSGPGSSVDTAARVFAERLAQGWGQPVVIDNRPGADGILAVQAFLHANDQHTLLFAFPGIVTVVPLLHEKLPYDPVADLAPITSGAYDFLAVAVASGFPGSSLGDLAAFVKVRRGTLNWTSPPGAPYLTFLEFQRRAGLTMTRVPYRGTELALPDLMAGQIHVAVSPLATALPLARDGRLKLLAVTTSERAVVARGLPTAIEAGFPELTVDAPLGFFGPKTMPMTVQERIAADVSSLASDPAIMRRLSDLGMVARGSTPTEYTAALAAQRARWTALARAYGVRPQ